MTDPRPRIPRPAVGLGLAFGLLMTVAPLALADPEGAHPLVERPFPQPPGLHLEAPCAVLVWQPSDGKGLELLGEAKLTELLSQRPALHVYALKLTSGKTEPESHGTAQLIQRGHVPSGYVRRLQADHTPFIVTVDLKGRVHRLSYVDHWPLLSAVESRFGPAPRPQEPWWRRLLHRLRRD